MAVYVANAEDAAIVRFIVGTGSTAQSGINTIQAVDVTDTMLGQGLYYFAMLCDNTTATFVSYNPTAAALSLQGCKEKAATINIPLSSNLATATLEIMSAGFTPIMGGEFDSMSAY